MKNMKVVMLWLCLLGSVQLQAQVKIDDERMDRDLEVGENVLSTLIRQQFNKRNFFPFEVNASYSAGYGVTFRIPGELNGPMVFAINAEPKIAWEMNKDYSYSYSISSSSDEREEECEDCEKNYKNDKNDKSRKGPRKATYRRTSDDSLVRVANQKVIAAAKDFIIDYGDLISQLPSNERIKITNRGEGQNFWMGGPNSRRHFMSIEGLKSDVTLFRQGKLTRDQVLAKIAVVDSETSDEMSPDLELLSSIFNRLYRADLSKSYYVQNNIYYERLKDYGVVYYMQVYSSNQVDLKKYDMPTVRLEDIDKPTRDKKVKELYPVFEKDIKESVLEYGRTVKSLKNDEVLVFNIKLTQCEACAIPSSLELMVKESVLSDLSSGRITKEAALAAMSVKKGPNQ